jgi:hypothetical protein
MLITVWEVQTLVNTGAESNPARATPREVRYDWKNVTFQIFKHNGILLSIVTDVLPVQINTALNQEGVERSSTSLTDPK